MKDYLLDLVEHTYDLGCIDLIKITGTDKETTVLGIAEDRAVVVEGKFHNPIPEFIGTFGMPNLDKLKIVLNLQEYRENAVITVAHKQTGEPEAINFTNSSGDFKNSYRYMVSAIVNDKLKNVTFKEPGWHVEFNPTVAGIQRLKWQAQAHADEKFFQARTDKNDLKFYFGDHSTHAGEFVFQHGVTGSLKRAWAWPVKQTIAIMDLNGDKTMKISDDGAAAITVDSGLATYHYILPAQTK
jgi:hypothetical protein